MKLLVNPEEFSALQKLVADCTPPHQPFDELRYVHGIGGMLKGKPLEVVLTLNLWRKLEEAKFGLEDAESSISLLQKEIHSGKA